MTTLSDAVDAQMPATLPLGGPLRVYERGAVPVSPGYPYGVYAAILGRAEGYSLTGVHGIRYGSVIVQTFGNTFAGADAVMTAITGALLDTPLAFDGYATDPLQFNLEPAVTQDPDDSGVIGITAAFTFAAQKES